MSFYDIVKSYICSSIDANGSSFNAFEPARVEKAIASEQPGPDDLAAILSQIAGKHLERMAEKAHLLTTQYFGRTMLLYTPLYLSNICDNHCSYCGFNASNHIVRKVLVFEDIEREAAAIAATGLKHIIVLTGESRVSTPVSYIAESIKILNKYFDSVSMEIYPLAEHEYLELKNAGADGIVIYQETYNEITYSKAHLKGPKMDYLYRLEAPERACKAGIRTIGIGSLLGLGPWRFDAFFTALHAQYLQNRYPGVEINVSLPRLRPHTGDQGQIIPVTDREFVQVLLAYRLFLPRVGITLSTREDAELRNALIKLGVTKISAGSLTSVGGHAKNSQNSEKQFEISDKRPVDEIKKFLYGAGYQPVLKDWYSLL